MWRINYVVDEIKPILVIKIFQTHYLLYPDANILLQGQGFYKRSIKE